MTRSYDGRVRAGGRSRPAAAWLATPAACCPLRLRIAASSTEAAARSSARKRSIWSPIRDKSRGPPSYRPPAIMGGYGTAPQRTPTSIAYPRTESPKRPRSVNRPTSCRPPGRPGVRRCAPGVGCTGPRSVPAPSMRGGLACWSRGTPAADVSRGTGSDQASTPSPHHRVCPGRRAYKHSTRCGRVSSIQGSTGKGDRRGDASALWWGTTTER
jgi:hypothetical protein